MNWYSLLPLNRYQFLGLILLFLGFFTAPFIVGFFIMPLGIMIMIYGFFLMICDLGKQGNWVYGQIKKIAGKFKKIKK